MEKSQRNPKGAGRKPFPDDWVKIPTGKIPPQVDAYLRDLGMGSAVKGLRMVIDYCMTANDHDYRV